MSLPQKRFQDPEVFGSDSPTPSATNFSTSTGQSSRGRSSNRSQRQKRQFILAADPDSQFQACNTWLTKRYETNPITIRIRAVSKKPTPVQDLAMMCEFVYIISLTIPVQPEASAAAAGKPVPQVVMANFFECGKEWMGIVSHAAKLQRAHGPSGQESTRFKSIVNAMEGRLKMEKGAKAWREWMRQEVKQARVAKAE